MHSSKYLILKLRLSLDYKESSEYICSFIQHKLIKYLYDAVYIVFIFTVILHCISICLDNTTHISSEKI